MDKKTIHNVDTPALLLDVDQMEKNISNIIEFAKKYNVPELFILSS